MQHMVPCRIRAAGGASALPCFPSKTRLCPASNGARCRDPVPLTLKITVSCNPKLLSWHKQLWQVILRILQLCFYQRIVRLRCLHDQRTCKHDFHHERRKDSFRNLSFFFPFLVEQSLLVIGDKIEIVCGGGRDAFFLVGQIEKE